jgi:hypothetical protein
MVGHACHHSYVGSIKRRIAIQIRPIPTLPHPPENNHDALFKKQLKHKMARMWFKW